jgi:hypothetical protein
VGRVTIAARSQVKFRAHGETGMTYTVAERSGDECTLMDYRARELHNVPAELLVEVGLPIRAADGMQ